MATIVASRYAVLSLDDDDSDEKPYSPKKKKNSNKKPVVSNGQNQVLKSECNNNKKKKKIENKQAPNTKKLSKTTNSGSLNKKKKEPESKQWEEWKEKDIQFVEENFEEELSKAILLSKLDYEKKKDFYNAVKISNAEEKKNNRKNDKKNKKVMSLSEFNGLDSKSSKSNTSLKVSKLQKENVKSEFFNQLDEDIKKEITKEQFLNKKKIIDPVTENLTMVLYKTSIEEKDKEIAELKAENERLNILLKNVKTRNTKLCQIIGNGEMKDKAEVLMEVERLQLIKDELSSEVANLLVQLEQERSKVRQLMAESRNKDKGKKHFHECS